MKYLLLLALIAGLAWWAFGRRRGAPPVAGKPSAADKASGKSTNKPQAMLACTHCGVHLPAAEVVADATGRPFCSEAHRLAGPR